MTSPLRLILLLHNHQPIGNFDGVFQQAYEDSYRPFLDVFEPFTDLRIALHTSGPLMEWLDQHHPDYLDRLAALVAAGRIEIVGGAFYEPILTMIPPRDRRGQIRTYTQWLTDRLNARIRGMWTPERVWEQSLTSDMAEAGIQYTLLDDFHFKNAGLDAEELFGYFVTENDGAMVQVFPGSERLRYTIPFADPHETIDYLAQVHANHPEAVVAFGDDGEKFGVWPDTKQHVYDNGWLVRFFEALSANRSWIDVTTPSDVLQAVPPLGRVYIPEGSYREMTEWALPRERLERLEDLRHDHQHTPLWDGLAPFIRGGYWRNFKVKYPETNEMYARMQMISRRAQHLAEQYEGDPRIEQARRELYRGQCNCGYWHGAFGGAYLPHLRNAVYGHLILAENLLHAIEPPAGSTSYTAGVWADARSGDFDFDGRPEIAFDTDRMFGLLAPAAGGMLYELDIRSIHHNLLATLARRPEAYHRKVLAGPSSNSDQVASIHDRVVFKQEGLDQRVQFDDYRRKSLLDHFYDVDVALDAVARGQAQERGDFLAGVYQATIRRDSGRFAIVQSRDGNALGYPLQNHQDAAYRSRFERALLPVRP